MAVAHGQTFVFLPEPHGVHREYLNYARSLPQLVPIQWNTESQVHIGPWCRSLCVVADVQHDGRSRRNCD
jgi:hypothetical protein